MNIKLLSLLGATAALIFSTGFVASAQTQQQSPPPRQQAPAQNSLNLTPDQQAKIQNIRQSTQTDILRILTDEQKNQIQTATARGENPRQIFASLNLTPEQQNRLKDIMQKSMQQIEGVLTPQQRQQLQQMRQQNRPQAR